MVTETIEDRSFAYNLAWAYAEAGHQVNLVKRNSLYQISFLAY
jgi:hypothetical protein